MSAVRYTDNGNLGKVFLISVNAKTTKRRDWDASSSPPWVSSVLSMVADGPIDTVALDTVRMFKQQVECDERAVSIVRTCNETITNNFASNFKFNILPRPDFTIAELTFDDVTDSRLNDCLQDIPTSLDLPRSSIDLLRSIGQYLLFKSENFINGMRKIDPSWQPPSYEIDKKLIDKACGPLPQQ